MAKLKEIRAIATSIMEANALTDWSFKYDKSVRRFGACYHYRRVISLNPRMVIRNSVERITETIYHEVAHALIGPNDGPKGNNGHGPKWAAQMVKFGYKPERYYGDDVATAAKKWQAHCTGHTHYRAKLRKSKIYYCTRTKAILKWEINPEWQRERKMVACERKLGFTLEEIENDIDF